MSHMTICTRFPMLKTWNQNCRKTLQWSSHSSKVWRSWATTERRANHLYLLSTIFVMTQLNNWSIFTVNI
jgi:hypothetical protein